MSAIFLLIALAGSVPSVDIQTTCRSARDAALPEDRAGAFQSCLRDEQDAKTQLQSKWKQYSASAHNACDETGGFSFSYVELRTCLEMQPGGSLSMQGLGSPSSATTPLGGAGTGLAPGMKPHQQPKP